MKVLLTEGSGLTSRQVAGLLWAKGHDVGVLSCDPLGLARFTRGIRRWHSIVAFGADPLGWLDSALEIYRTMDYDLLLPTQEQAAVLAAHPQRLADAGVVTAVPMFESLLAVQDKLAARSTLSKLGIAQPESQVLASRTELAAWDRFPVYIKTPIGTATSGVHQLDNPEQLRELMEASLPDEDFSDGGVLAQMPAAGPLAMVQTVFDQGRLIAFHANLRIRQGARGGASHKRSIGIPETRRFLKELGAALRWHGALSADVILTDTGASVIDINPRLVEPMNAHLSGVDLVQALIDSAKHNDPVEQQDGSTDVKTHQLLLAILGTAQHGRGRRGVAKELLSAIAHRRDYRDSSEELTPLRSSSGRRDWQAPIPVAAAAIATLIAPKTWRHFATTSVNSYALSPTGWRDIKAAAIDNLRI